MRRTRLASILAVIFAVAVARPSSAQIPDDGLIGIYCKPLQGAGTCIVVPPGQLGTPCVIATLAGATGDSMQVETSHWTSVKRLYR